MKNKTKKVFVGLLSFATLSFASGAVIADGTIFASANTETAVTAQTATASMVEGASVYADSKEYTDNGIRFSMYMTSADYTALVNAAQGESATVKDIVFGCMIVPQAYFIQDFSSDSEQLLTELQKVLDGNGEKYTVDTEDTEKKQIWEVNGSQMTYVTGDSKLSDGYYFNGVMTNVIEDNIDRKMIGVGYFGYTDVKTNESVKKLASFNGNDIENNTRSMVEVAYAAIQDDSDLSSLLSTQYIDKCSYSVEFDTDGGTSVDSQTVKYGEKVSTPKTKPDKNGYIFDKWTVDGDAFDFNTRVKGNGKITASYKHAPSAFGSYITDTSYFTYEKDNQTYNATLGEMEKDGATIGIINNSAGVALEATEKFNDLIPSTTKEIDNVVVDVYLVTESAVIMGDITTASLAAKTWHTIKCSYAGWKTKTKVYSNGAMQVANFRIESVKLLQAFGQEISDTSYFYKININPKVHPTFDQIEKDGVQVGAVCNFAGASLVATDEFNALIPTTAKSTDYVAVDVYFYGASDFIMGEQTTSGYQEGNWYTISCTVAQWKNASKLYSNCKVGVANFRIVPKFSAFGQEVSFTNIYSNATLTIKDDEEVVKVAKETTANATNAFKALLPSTAKDSDEISFKMYLTSSTAIIHDLGRNNYQWTTDQWIDVTVTVEKFKVYGVYSWGEIYLKGFTYTAL